MKLNKTLMMAALMAGGILAANTAVRAQTATNAPAANAAPPGAPTAPRNRVDALAARLELTDDQKPKFKVVYEDMMQQLMDLRKDATTEPADRRAKMMQIRNDATTKLKDVLTPEQLQKWQLMMSGNRRPPGAPVQPPAGGTPPPAAGSTPPATGGTPPQQ